MIQHQEKITDLRIRRTHHLLIEALKSLLREQPFDEIHITDICERAMVHRTTFYKHFLDKYDLLSFALQELQESFDQKSILLEQSGNEKEYFMRFFRQVLEYMAEHKKMYLVGLKDLRNEAAVKILYNFITKKICEKLEYHKAEGVVYKIPTDIIAEFYVGALFSMANWWIERDMPVSIDGMVQYANMMIADEHFVLKSDK